MTSTGQVLTSPEDSGGAALRTRRDLEGADSPLAESEPGSMPGDPDDLGLPPEFGETDPDYGAPEDGVPQIEGPPPEASDPGVTGTAPEDSEPPDDG